MQPRDRLKSFFADNRLPWLLAIICAAIFFLDLGGAALFEPDEGRNAERAREILLLGNWVIPHENFLPALDKPIFFYWLIALSYKLLGISEWTARLPSVLAASGCLLMLCGFVRSRWGLWESIGSVLILSSCVQFFLYARIVIFDMTLTFLITLTLFEFYRAVETGDPKTRWRHCLPMYTAVGLATLVKGPIGTVIPGMVIFFYFVLTRKWRLIPRMHPVVGPLLFFAVVAPWYVLAELRNPGYLRYFLWEENFLRFITPHFHRSNPWYYFLLVIAAGFSPWCVLIPSTVGGFWKKRIEDRDLFMIVWIVLPLIFFSLSNSKLPHYILPIFPPLAILAAKSLRELVNDASARSRWQLSLPMIVVALCSVYLIAGTMWDGLLPPQIRHTVKDLSRTLWACGLLTLLVLARFVHGAAQGKWREQRFVYLCYGGASLVFMLLLTLTYAAASYDRSAKRVAEAAAPLITPDHQLVFYDGYLTGMPFYLRTRQPIWIVWSGEHGIIMDNMFVSEQQPHPAAGYGQVLFTYEQFDEEWKQSIRPLFVIVEKKHLRRLALPHEMTRRILRTSGEFAMVTNRGTDTP